jgi:hypothetical protein
VAEELLEAEAVEEPEDGDDLPPVEEPRRLPEPVSQGQLDAWRGEVRTAALAAAGGLVAGAATVAVVRAARNGAARGRSSRRLARRQERRPVNVIASRSFLVDVHLLGNR